MTAWIIGGWGVLMGIWVGCIYFGFSVTEILVWVGVSNLSALVSVILTLRLEKVTWVKARVLAGSMRTWLFLSFAYFGLLLSLAPGLRDRLIFMGMILPLLMSTGLMLNPILGPIQDGLVRGAQQRERLKTRLAADRS